MRFSFVTCFVLAVGLAACNKGQNQAQTQAAEQQAANVTSGNPSDGNLAPMAQGTPPESSSGESYAPPPEYDQDNDQAASYEQPVQASEPPPPLPDYEQPPCPGDDYMWTPGYWDYADAGYYWVPGAWVLAPYVGALWTPPWWGFDNGVYIWHAGYWGPHIGFYGGVDYGFGYTGRGYYGAYWNHGQLDYNSAVTNVNVTVIHNVYSYSVPNSRPGGVSYNGGRGGINARPTAAELAVQREARTPAVAAQVRQARDAASDKGQFVKPGTEARPATVAASKPLATSYHAPAARPPAVHPAAPPARVAERPAPQPAQHGPAQATREAVPPQRPEVRPTPQSTPEARPAPVEPQARPQERATAPRPEARPAPQQRAVAPRPEARPAPQPTPAPRGRAQARVQSRPAPARPAPQARPAPHPAPTAHPAAPKKEDERK